MLDAGALRVDTGSRRAWSEGAELTLSQKEFDLLTCLIRNRGMALSRDVLLERVWGYDFLGDSRTVDVRAVGVVFVLGRSVAVALAFGTVDVAGVSEASLPSRVCSIPLRSVQKVPGPA